MGDFTVKTSTFEGPLGLLLSLIERRKFFINEISLAKVTDDYINHVNNLSEYSIPDRADFIVIASTLILIKSRSLLPALPLSEEEEESIEGLENRLKEYKRIKELSVHIRNMYGKNISYLRNENKWQEVVFRASSYINCGTLNKMIEGVINSFPTFQILPKVVVQKIKTLEEAMKDLSNRIKFALKTSFKEMTGEIKTKEDKINTIINFLALLELMKRGVIAVTQNDLFDSIEIETENVNLPNYK